MSQKSKLLEGWGEGVQESFDPDLRRAFDVADQEVDESLRDPTKLRMQEGMLKLSGDGMFYTLQGEGLTMGEPVVFLRLHICNLRCGWCDAYYTWNPKSEEFWTESYDVSIEDVAEGLRNTWGCEDATRKRRAVITGGEPLIQKGKIDALINMLPDWDFEIETNGTIMPTDLQLERCQFNCSPKLSNSSNIKGARIKPEVLQAIAQANSIFKFVVMTDEDLDEIETDFVKGVGIPRDKILLMPQGVTSEEVRHNAQVVAEYAKKKGYRLMGRLQVDLWGAVRRR